MMDFTHRTETTCPYCKHKSTHTAGPEAPPQEGDLSFCIRCAEPAIFRKDLSLREPTVAERIAAQMDNEDLIKRIKALP